MHQFGYLLITNASVWISPHICSYLLIRQLKMTSRMRRRHKLKFNMKAVEHLLAQVKDTIEDGGELNENGKRKRVLSRKAEYLMGYTIVPKNIMEGGDAFSPIDSLDCGTCYSGVLVVRAKKDANNNVHVGSCSRLAGAECPTTVGAHCRAEKFIMGKKNIFSRKQNLTISDGGYALRHTRREHYPNSWQMSCARHFREECKRKHVSKEDMQKYEVLLKLGKNQMKAAQYLYDQLPAQSHIRSRPKEELFPVFFPAGVCNHGETTNQSAEVCMHMLRAVRDAPNILSSLLELLSILRRRNRLLRDALLAVKAGALAAGDRKEVSWSAEWPTPSSAVSSFIPVVHDELTKLSYEAAQMAKVEEVTTDEGLNSRRLHVVYEVGTLHA